VSAERLLLLDFGGVCLLNPVELHHVAERRLGLAAGTLDWLGPIDPSTDELWRRMVAGDGITEREYWAHRAGEVGGLAGEEWTTRDYMRFLYEPARPDLIRPSCVDVVNRARVAGRAVSVLTNDMRAFHGRTWEHDIPLLQEVDHVVDCSDYDVLKPHPRAYQRALDITGFAAGDVLFIDDQPRNVEGAEQLGMASMWFDVANADASWTAVADRFGL